MFYQPCLLEIMFMYTQVNYSFSLFQTIATSLTLLLSKSAPYKIPKPWWIIVFKYVEKNLCLEMKMKN